MANAAPYVAVPLALLLAVAAVVVAIRRRRKPVGIASDSHAPTSENTDPTTDDQTDATEVIKPHTDR
ncbi:hypothetical protein [Streptosporangium sp. OZ121]|uniref:hypothetical protein n=1 Tax=Streptosporangium sp. OZ121 TaxID=3444183 RepID=UPI003F79EE69